METIARHDKLVALQGHGELRGIGGQLCQIDIGGRAVDGAGDPLQGSARNHRGVFILHRGGARLDLQNHAVKGLSAIRKLHISGFLGGRIDDIRDGLAVLECKHRTLRCIRIRYINNIRVCTS